ncbi:MAG: hypothetical protein QOH08_2244 [Chloroflexota bacterium]|jgi:hypothetical protein|nr:hypothetical protein [Chloroflexota bacterium]
MQEKQGQGGPGSQDQTGKQGGQGGQSGTGSQDQTGKQGGQGGSQQGGQGTPSSGQTPDR